MIWGPYREAKGQSSGTAALVVKLRAGLGYPSTGGMFLMPAVCRGNSDWDGET